MSTIHPLDQPIERWSLLKSKFYLAWSAGTLPRSALQSYARQYGSFISLVPLGWMAQGDHEIAEEERSHIELWRRFAYSLDTDIGPAKNDGVVHLVSTARGFFAREADSIGALYAFEAQQPATSTSKLLGLREHYQVARTGEEYFEVHKDDYEEPTLLRERFDTLPEEGRVSALRACETMCTELRHALDSLHEEESDPLELGSN